jgi:AcrR family transcriptional regulator
VARNKYPEVTVEKILDVAQRLFLKKGYDETTIQDIVNELGGLTKGAIYHHFKSKEEIVEAVVRNMMLDGESFFSGDHEKYENGYTALEKLKNMILASFQQGEGQDILWESEALLKNPKFLTNHMNACIQHIIPRVHMIIEEGNRDGSMNVEQIDEVAEMITLLLNIWCIPAIFPTSPQQFVKRFELLRKQAESMGIPFIDDEVMDACKEFAQKYVR